MVCFMTPVAWARNFAKFSFTYMLGNFLVLVVVTMLVAQSLKQLVAEGPSETVETWNESGFLPMVGFAIYSYEGIGLVMPIMQQTSSPDSFMRLLTWAIGTLTLVYVIFGSTCYSAYGSETSPIMTEMMPPSVVTSTIKILFCVNMIFGYSICIHPTNMILENWVFSGFKASRKRTWAKNVSRGLVCMFAAFLAVVFENNIGKFLAFLGALLCAPLALILPTLLHLKVLAATDREKVSDCVLLLLSVFVFIFSTSQSIINWK